MNSNVKDVSVFEEEDKLTGALTLDSARQKAELDQQITTARSFPRSVRRFIDATMSLVTLNEDTAAGMIYSLPRGGKPIEGPSARFAEVVAHTWGNNHSGGRVVDEGDEFVTAEGVFTDLQTNTKVVLQVKRRITNKEGQRFNADMIMVTGNAAVSIAHRNAVLKGVPKSFWNPMYIAARQAAIGDVKTIALKRTEALQYVAKFGVPEAQVFAALGVDGVEDIDIDKLTTLRALVQSVKDKERTIDEAFPHIEPRQPKSTKGKPETKAPKAKAGAGNVGNKGAKVELIVGNNGAKVELLSTDQLTAIRDRLKEEGVAESVILAMWEIGKLEEIHAADFAEINEAIDEASNG